MNVTTDTTWNALATQRVPATSCSDRPAGFPKPTHIVLHTTGSDNYAACLERLTTEVSSHYIIRVDGELVQLVPDHRMAWHAGISYPGRAHYAQGDAHWKQLLCYGGDAHWKSVHFGQLGVDYELIGEGKYQFAKRKDGQPWPKLVQHEATIQARAGLSLPVGFGHDQDPNAYSIGIEIMQAFTRQQYETLVRLLLDLCGKYDIPYDAQHIIAHEDVHPMARWGWDPGPRFDWGVTLCTRRALAQAPASTEPPSEARPSALPARRWGFPIEPDRDADWFYDNNERGEGGYYPIGENKLWHSGIHLHGSGSVHAAANGRIIAARLEEQVPDDAPDGGETNRNFVLIEHEVPVGTRGGNRTHRVFSLYMHLKPVHLRASDEEASRIPWLRALLAATQYTVTCAGLSLRSEPRVGDETLMLADGQPLGLKAGDTVRALGDEQNGWVEVDHGGRTGWIQVALPGNRRLAEPAVVGESDAGPKVDRLRQGEVVALDVPVERGDVVGLVGRNYGAGTLHFEIFSADDIEISQFAEFVRASDGDNDGLCEAGGVTSRADKDRVLFIFTDGNVSESEARRAAPRMREVICTHTSEWAAEDWSFLRRGPFNLRRETLDARLAEIEYHQWWKPAARAGVALPDPMVTTYHPIRFVEALNEHLLSSSLPLEIQVETRLGGLAVAGLEVRVDGEVLGRSNASGRLDARAGVSGGSCRVEASYRNPGAQLREERVLVELSDVDAASGGLRARIVHSIPKIQDLFGDEHDVDFRSELVLSEPSAGEVEFIEGGSALRLTIRLCTLSLDVPYLNQNAGNQTVTTSSADPDTSGRSVHGYADDGRFPGYHLCFPTCVAMLLRYWGDGQASTGSVMQRGYDLWAEGGFGGRPDKRTDNARQVVEAETPPPNPSAATWWLDTSDPACFSLKRPKLDEAGNVISGWEHLEEWQWRVQYWGGPVWEIASRQIGVLRDQKPPGTEAAWKAQGETVRGPAGENQLLPLTRGAPSRLKGDDGALSEVDALECYQEWLSKGFPFIANCTATLGHMVLVRGAVVNTAGELEWLVLNDPYGNLASTGSALEPLAFSGSLGDRGDNHPRDVELLQEVLTLLDRFAGPIDGRWSSGVRDALAAYQGHLSRTHSGWQADWPANGSMGASGFTATTLQAELAVGSSYQRKHERNADGPGDDPSRRRGQHVYYRNETPGCGGQLRIKWNLYHGFLRLEKSLSAGEVSARLVPGA